MSALKENTTIFITKKKINNLAIELEFIPKIIVIHKKIDTSPLSASSHQ